MRKTPLRRRKRTSAEYRRIYGSPERVTWVKSLPCVVCGAVPSDNHHIENGGTGRKADANKIIPLCERLGGCHDVWDNLGRDFLMEIARERTPRRHGPLLVWDHMREEWRECETWASAAETVDRLWAELEEAVA